jgi:hypothetical protein
MSYLPDLRASLVKAAHRQQTAAREGRTRSRRFSAGGVATLLAAAVGIAVAVLALTVIGHGNQKSQTAGGTTGTAPSAAAKQAAARAAAVRTLNQLVLPPGAVKSGLVPGTPASLWSPADKLSTLHRVDVHRVWRVPGNPQQVINFIEQHRPAGSQQGAGSESGFSRSKRGPAVVDSATIVFGFPSSPGATIVRELAVEAFRIRGGGSALRADGEAGWIVPRSAAERIPAGTERVVARTVKPPTARTGQPNAGHRVQLRTIVVTSPARIKGLVATINSLPLAQPGVFRCLNGPGYRLRFTFYSASAATPAADAVFNPVCGRIRLTIGGRTQPDLTLVTPNGLVQEGPQLKELSSFGIPIQRRR